MLVDVLMPGKVTELYPMEGFGKNSTSAVCVSAQGDSSFWHLCQERARVCVCIHICSVFSK